MAVPVYQTQTPLVNLDPHIRTITIRHRTYQVWEEADRFYIHAMHTGAVRQFRSADALTAFVTELRRRIDLGIGVEAGGGA
jgi:hypothetical protein